MYLIITSPHPASQTSTPPGLLSSSCHSSIHQSQPLSLRLDVTSINHGGILLLHLDLHIVLVLLDLLLGGTGLLGDLGLTSSSGLGLSGSASRVLVTPAVADGHLAETFFGAFGVLETQGCGDGILVRVGLLGHVVEDGFDEAKFAVGHAGGAISLSGGGGFLGRHRRLRVSVRRLHESEGDRTYWLSLATMEVLE